MAQSKKSSPNGQQSPSGKGKAKEVLASVAPVAAPAPAPASDEDNALLDLADAITARAHVLVPGKADLDLARRAQQVVKASFDRALASEAAAFPHLSSLLQSLSPSSAPSTRSSAKAPPPAAEEALALNPTPLEELTTDGMDPEMIWEQMEMRAGVVVELLEEMFGGGSDAEGSDAEGGPDEGSDDGEDEDMFDDDNNSEDEDEESDSDTSERSFHEEEFSTTLGPAGVAAEDLEGGADSDDDEQPVDPLADENAGLTLDTFDSPGSGRPQRRAPGPPSAVDDEFFSLHDFHVQVDEGEFEMSKSLRGEVDDDEDGEGGEDDFDLFAPVADDEDEPEDAEEEDLDGAGIMYKDFFDPPPRPLGKDKGKGKDATGKKGKGSKGKPRADAPGPSSPAPAAAAAAPAPSSTTQSASKKRKVHFSEAVKVKTIAPRGSVFDKLVAKVGWEEASRILEEESSSSAFQPEEDEEDFEMEMAGGAEGEEESDEEDGEEGDEDDEEMDEDEEMEDGEGSEGEDGSDESDGGLEEGLETIERLKTSLFDEEENSDEEGSTPAASLSRHERRLLALSSQIAELEAENVGAKDWATKGEAKARDRPVNSLLEEDLEYERAGKVEPVITEETTKTIEDLIKKRILDNEFDDVVRQRAVDPNAFLPSRFMEIQDTKSNKSLAEIYEEDYTTAKEKDAGREVVHELDKDLEKKHAEIEELFEELSGKLDALSNARFTPKPPKATITTISNVPAIALESALPATTTTSTLLAPEEVFVPDPTNEDRSDFTPSQKKQARQKRRKARASIAKAAEKFSAGAKGDKERATKELVGTKGVTVLGKGGKVEVGKKRKRDGEDDGRSGVSLKL
ncbi:hypothetical protein RQP46_008401 [Phenoliferia psychrophenolica]